MSSFSIENRRTRVSALLFFSLTLSLAGCASSPHGSSEENSWQTVSRLNNQEGNPQAAVAEAERILANEPNNYGVRYWMADAYKDMGQLNQAAQQYQRIISESDDPDWKSGAHINMAWFYFQNDQQKALNHLDEAQMLRPLIVDSFILRGWTYIYQGRYQEALTIFEHVVENPGLSTSMIIQYDKVLEGHRGKAYALLGIGKVDEALAELTRAETGKAQWSADTDRAVIYYAVNDNQKLIDMYAGQGILGADITNTTVASGQKQVKVSRIFAGSAAEKAGIEPGDIFVSYDGVPSTSAEELINTISSSKPGVPVPVTLMRNSQPMTVTAVPDARLERMQIWAAQQLSIQALLARRKAMQEIENADVGGDLRSAFQLCVDYLNDTRSTSLKKPVTEKCIGLVHRLSPPPAIPEAAVRHAARAETMLRMATNDSEITSAEREFEKALDLAPWWADAWFNLGVAQRNAGKAAQAIDSFRMFLLAAPDDPAANQVQQEIYGLEVEVERTAQQGDWSGRWADEGGSIFKLEKAGKQVNFVFVRPDSIDSGRGYKRGDLRLAGDVDSNRLRGKMVFRSTSDSGRRCFGNTFEEEADGELGKGGYSLTLKWFSSTYGVESCKTKKRTEQTMTYYKLP